MTDDIKTETEKTTEPAPSAPEDVKAVLFNGPIDPKALELNRRLTTRRFVAALVSAMAETDTSFKLIGKRVGQDERLVRRAFMKLLDGQEIPLKQYSDYLFACGGGQARLTITAQQSTS